MSIRQIGKLVAQIERESNVEFIHLEMGVPGLPACEIGTAAEKRALDSGVASLYPNIEGIAELKTETAQFAKLFLNIDVAAQNCIPTVGAMQGSFAALIAAARTDAQRPYTLFIDPGFPVNKQQLQIMGLPYRSIDLLNFRDEKLAEQLETMLAAGDICSITYSSPNNPSWLNLSEKELESIGKLADKYDVIVVEDLAYFAMDFRHNYGSVGVPPFQPTVAHYTDNYVLLLSASKIFNYAGQRIGIMLIGNELSKKRFANLKNYFSDDAFFNFVVYGLLYATTSGTSHTAQYALAAMLKAVNAGEYPFVEKLLPYADKAQKIKTIFRKYGFSLVYSDADGSLADGFYFTVSYPGLTSGELLREFLYSGISAVSLSITGSTAEGLRICVSQVRDSQLAELDSRLQLFLQRIK
jgi:aspartate/methionine/tyrosine aminotransferase